ncbi:MAG: UDP-N-acetylmuramoylalanyl-D-glutamyl-2,6-diaminopimelate--D-alanyl-D-alanine ligase [Rhodospirillales bacterium]|jgi:UDP-N-acetylmuramoyl-tripeptide--D-alanyl-D-alanine ligase|nr:UDP-N-acetylmuramoylalanyl-D-glutamyl-2, 6-diaminopimelate--D-alanyl-D-alanine ligase [Rhodospirillaceae bacterium]MDP6428724.1 UDP-N-acetylmuramoylalanyl-D-glutamyl-2,6-diaminopimelate--D-alanyl-D-alanine ligase [Rhodospirillales bacterium]MDP6643805.1 UDP-N-acetylmuramoylalanyl-D-glutamyl-2,6-diaminopimelate--D-alanyl-D-alanine ligase [Rhodospirillales bacterium]MDP6841305.1 UDP-N-acetylmuramoylalanyl-D-glutamyl-2,6-diaminopimelate--D-alanyl-D-alanine ligase [Rhodospirillales bacterium]
MNADPNPALWSAEAAAAATGGTVSGNWTAGGVSIDSRSLKPGDLFIALKGPNFDGHEFLDAAFAAGAAAAMVSDRAAAAGGQPLLGVDDTMTGLDALGAAGRARAHAKVVAVTGSVGKTGVKEALARLLGRQGETGFSAGSFNNHIGVPLSLSRLSPSARFAVFELGMNHAGELTPLSRMARPDVAMVTNVEAVHTAYFASLEEIAEAKSEIFAGLEPGGTAILNRDNPYFDLLAERARQAGAALVTGFGADAKADFRLLEFDLGAEYSSVKAGFRGRTLEYRLGLPGRHWVQNSLAILAAVDAVGADIFEAARAMAELTPAVGRGRRHLVDSGQIEFLLIDESYNASPVSMMAALEVLASLQPGPMGRRIAVLGDMLELGPESGEMHRRLAAAVTGNQVDLVFTAGDRMGALFGALPGGRRGTHHSGSEELAATMGAALKSGDVVLVKGSAGSRMGAVVAALLAMDRGNRSESDAAKATPNGEAPNAV